MSDRQPVAIIREADGAQVIIYEWPTALGAQAVVSAAIRGALAAVRRAQDRRVVL